MPFKVQFSLSKCDCTIGSITSGVISTYHPCKYEGTHIHKYSMHEFSTHNTVGRFLRICHFFLLLAGSTLLCLSRLLSLAVTSWRFARFVWSEARQILIFSNQTRPLNCTYSPSPYTQPVRGGKYVRIHKDRFSSPIGGKFLAFL